MTFLEDADLAEIPDESEHGAPLAALLQREQFDRIRAALSMLRPCDREIIALSYERDLSSKEIMEIMRKPSVTAVTTHLYKAMQKLRSLVLADGAAEAQRIGGSDARIGIASSKRGGGTARHEAREKQQAALLWR